MLLGLIETAAFSQAKKTASEIQFNFDFSQFKVPGNLIWIAPIRTKPLRFYDGREQGFSPEGTHAPHVLLNMLQNVKKSPSKTHKGYSLLEEFGKNSGMFEAINAHRFGKSNLSPFEILIGLSKASLAINNVGSGISQVLPVVIDSLNCPTGSLLAVQQPEVHLHPRAQAALGDFIYRVSGEKRLSFILETHSDFLIDRFRLALKNGENKPKSSVVFFKRTEYGNEVSVIYIGEDGKYTDGQPSDFRAFFLNEAISMLDV